ncbi:MAG: TetR/AcrR family transcriptional regulator [Pseudomonadota bacterium]
MTDDKLPYHHGDLREVLVNRAIDQVEQDGLTKLSLRKIAADVGVSHNAPYMHFANKDALLVAVVAEGFALLRAAIAEAGGTEELRAEDWQRHVKAGFAAYVHFARLRPRLYAFMHQPLGAAPTQGDGTADALQQAGPAALTRLAGTLATGQRLGLVRSGDPSAQALWVWATLHGLAGLTGNARQSFGERTPDQVTDEVLDQLLDGLSTSTS